MVPVVRPPTRDRIMAVMDEVEDEGGRVLTRVHRADVIDYEVPYTDPRTGAMKKREIQVSGAGCGQEALVTVPYRPPWGEDGEDHEVEVCIIDDAVDRWPRFQGIEPVEYA